MIYLYIAVSLILCVVLVGLAKKVARIARGEFIICMFFSVDVLIGLFHYKLFMNSQVGPVLMEPSWLQTCSSLLFFIYSCTVPVMVLRKAILESQRTSRIIVR